MMYQLFQSSLAYLLILAAGCFLFSFYSEQENRRYRWLIWLNRILFLLVSICLNLIKNDCENPWNRILTIIWFVLETTLPLLWNLVRWFGREKCIYLGQRKPRIFLGFAAASFLWALGIWARLTPFGVPNYMESNIGLKFCTVSIHHLLYPLFPLRSWYGWEANWSTGLLLTVLPAYWEKNGLSLMALWGLVAAIIVMMVDVSHQFFGAWSWSHLAILASQLLI